MNRPRSATLALMVLLGIAGPADAAWLPPERPSGAVVDQQQPRHITLSRASLPSNVHADATSVEVFNLQLGRKFDNAIHRLARNLHHRLSVKPAERRPPKGP